MDTKNRITGNTLELTPQQVELEYSLPRSTLANLRWKHAGPRYRKVGRKVLYNRLVIEEWLDRHSVTPSNQQH